MALGIMEAIVLGIVQGATEWLPVSSSGHLTIAQEVLGVEVPVAYDLLLHMATLVVVLAAYRRRLWSIAHALVDRRWDEPDARLGLLLVIGTVPIAVVGLLAKDVIEAAFDDLRVVGWSLVWTGLVLASTWRAHDRTGKRILQDARARDAWWVGAWQVLALLPGVSRSGMTIAAGLHAGLDRRAAADLAFLLAVPALLAAAVLKAPAAPGLAALGWGPLVAGTIASGLMGWMTLWTLRRIIARYGIAAFSLYCLPAGTAVLLVW